MNKNILTVFIFIFSYCIVQGQEDPLPKRIVTYARVVDGDTIPFYDLATINVSATRVFLSEK